MMNFYFIGKIRNFFLILQGQKSTFDEIKNYTFCKTFINKKLPLVMNNSYFTDRRSVRNFSAKEVPDSLLRSILERAEKAPTTGNMQLYSVIVSRDEEMRRMLAPLHFSQPASVNAPVLLTVCADLYRFTRWCSASNAEAGFDNFLSFTSAFADAMIYAQQVVTIAEMEGLGTVYLGTVIYNAPEIAKLLQLPRLVVPVACIALGWPEGEGEPTERLGLDGIIHIEKYHDYSDEEIFQVFKVKEDYEPNRGYVAQNGKENLAQVFAEVRYPKAMNEDFSRKFIDYLNEIGLWQKK